MGEYASKFLRKVFGALLGEDTHTRVYEDPILRKINSAPPEKARATVYKDPILRKMKPVPPEILHGYR